MFAVPLKEAKGVDWSGPLRTYLSNNYSAEVLDKHAASVQRLSTTREMVSNATGASSSSVEALESYLRMLGEVEPRFPLGEGGLKLSFTWFDALNPQKKLSMPVVAYERASVLFNLAAVLSHQGIVQDRADESGLKKACTFFQRAAGIFEHLKSKVVGQELTGPTLSDLSPEGLEMLSSLMLAQAQACFYEKAMLGKQSPSVLSKLASKAKELYGHALEQARLPVFSATLDKAWASYLEFNLRLFAACAQLQYSKVVHAQAEQTTVGYGEEIARLALASENCEAALAVARGSKQLPAGMVDNVTHVRSVIHKAMDEASENNNKIYMQVIPNKRELAEPPGTALAKAIVPAEELVQAAAVSGAAPAASGTAAADRVFAGLLPVAMQDAEATFQSKLSLLVEQSGNKVTAANEEIKLRLAEAGLPAAVEAGDGASGLPAAVWERLQSAVGRRGGVEGLRRGIESNAALSRKADIALGDVERALGEEEQQDTRCRSTWGQQWATSSSAELSMHMRADIARYRQLLREARASDEVLAGKLQSSASRMEVVGYSRARLDQLFPKANEVDSAPEVERTREALALMLVTLGSNVQELERLQGQLVDAAAKDSVAPAMSRAPGGPRAVASSKERSEALISAELQKYRALQLQIDQRIQQNPQLLNKVLEKNHMFSAMRNQSEAMLKREGLIAEIDAGIQHFEEIVMFIQEGEKFYLNLAGRIEQLRTTATDHCYVRDMQRKELEADLAARAASAGGAGGPPGRQQQQQQAPPPPYPGGGGAYPGMNSSARPGMQRESSAPFVQPYVPAQAFPIDSAPAPAFPLNSRAAAQAPPPPYAAAKANSADSAKVQQIRAMLGTAYTDAQIVTALDGAGGDVNTAVNHLLSNQDNASPSKRTSKRFGVF